MNNPRGFEILWVKVIAKLYLGGKFSVRPCFYSTPGNLTSQSQPEDPYVLLCLCPSQSYNLLFLFTTSLKGSQEQQADADPRPQEVSTNSWYSPSSNKSADELRKLLSDKEAYQQFLLSLDLVKTPNNLRDELRNETLQLARENLAKESCMTELRNQCMIIRTTELATAEEKLNELNRQKAEILRSYSPASLLHQLQELINKTDEESEMLHKQLLEKEMDVASFVHKYKKLRVDYHKRALTHLAATTSLSG
ncbi:unnamed protein product [Lactuca saligna]|uniref:VPS37 C-terminal domain-containing protein n=1 Tax=Lactuca saligna TaxID=75948 RepID=A0AA35YFE8_LACSI|nr:unnamed protein product [Lactuca saligna]